MRTHIHFRLQSAEEVEVEIDDLPINTLIRLHNFITQLPKRHN